MKIGDLIKLSLRGRMSIGEANITDRFGIVIGDSSYYNSLVEVHWLTTGRTGEVHTDFIEKVEKNT